MALFHYTVPTRLGSARLCLVFHCVKVTTSSERRSSESLMGQRGTKGVAMTTGYYLCRYCLQCKTEPSRAPSAHRFYWSLGDEKCSTLDKTQRSSLSLFTQPSNHSGGGAGLIPHRPTVTTFKLLQIFCIIATKRLNRKNAALPKRSQAPKARRLQQSVWRFQLDKKALVDTRPKCSPWAIFLVAFALQVGMSQCGQCPMILTVVPSSRGCTSDRDCAGGHKCCQFPCGPACVPPVFTKPGECPSTKNGGGNCDQLCSYDSDCADNDKCCSNGCGRQCMAPYTVSPAAEPPKPAAEPPKPAAEPPKPAAEPPKPAAEPPKPAAEPPKPAAEPPKPAAEPPKPAMEPAAEPPKPAMEPAAEPPKPAVKPAAEPPKPVMKPAAKPPKPAGDPAAEPPKPAVKPAAKPPKPAGDPAAEPPKPAVKPAEPPKPAVKPAAKPPKPVMKPAAEPPKPAVKPAEPPKPAVKPAEPPKPAVKPAEPPKPAAEPPKPAVKPAEPPKPAELPKPAVKPAAERPKPAVKPACEAPNPAAELPRHPE
ncbi:perlwapin [Pimephales promelas]|nr:perlwapin [Pimephales promelas]